MGRPANSMLTNVVQLYHEDSINNSTGYASSLAWTLTLIILGIQTLRHQAWEGGSAFPKGMGCIPEDAGPSLQVERAECKIERAR